MPHYPKKNKRLDSTESNAEESEHAYEKPSEPLPKLNVWVKGAGKTLVSVQKSQNLGASFVGQVRSVPLTTTDF